MFKHSKIRVVLWSAGRLLAALLFMPWLICSTHGNATLVFNEIMYHPAVKEPDHEWLEFYNQLAVDLDVTGWRVTGDIDFVFPSGVRVAGQGYLLLALNPTVMTATSSGIQVVGPFIGRLGNQGGTLELRNADGRLMDRVRFQADGHWPVTPDGSGVSLAKWERDSASEPPQNWTASASIAGTPGKENFPTSFGAGLMANRSAVPVTTLTFNELSGISETNFWVELRNNGTNQLAFEGWILQLNGTNDADYVFPPGTAVDAGGMLVLTEFILGFRPAIGDRLFLFTTGRAQVMDGVVVDGMPAARHPDGSGRWLYPSVLTPGASNQFSLRTAIVINEIMYRRALAVPTNNEPVPASTEQWIELHNRTTQAVDLTGWEIDGGIQYRFGAGQRLTPGGYLVVARDADQVRQLHPTAEVVGDFSGRLSSRSDWIVLRDPLGNPADEVQYFDSGHWPAYADGGGSSLELTDPLADNARPEAWAASDETGQMPWQSFSYRAVAGYHGGTQPTQWRDFILGLLDAGECLLDDLSVVESPGGTPAPMISNGDFENGLTGWRSLGNHSRSRVIVDPDNAANHVLHLMATGPQEHMHNHLETTLVSNRSVVDGREYLVSFRARWLAGNNRLNTRLYFNRVARTTALPTPARSGTPGAPNSRRTGNHGPTFTEFYHQPVIPAANQSVTVRMVAQDPQGVAAGWLCWSANGGTWYSTTMDLQPEGRYEAAIPGQPAGTVVQFYVQATDRTGLAATYPPMGPKSGALYTVNDGQANFQRGHNLRLVLTPANRDLLHAFTNVMSNDELPCTVVYDERRAYYDTRLRLKGSQRGRYSDTRVSYHLRFQPEDLFRGVHPVLLIDRSGAGDSTSNKQLEVLIKHLLLRAGGIPGTHPDLCRVIAPKPAHTSSAILSPRHEDEFLQTAYPDGGDGTLFEMELIYYPTSANAAGYKNPQPDSVLGVDLQDLGDDPELYRYHFMIKNHRDADDYQRFIQFASALSLSGDALDRQTRGLMDVDAWMRAWALVTLCGVGDSYTFGNNHNLLMYVRPTDNRVVPFPVDMDFAFVRGATDGLVGGQNLSRVINLPANLRLFYGHIVEIVDSAFNQAYMSNWISHYNHFVPEQNFASVSEYIRQRGQHALSVINAAGGNAQLAVNGPSTITTTNNLVTLSGMAPVTVRTLQINGVEWPVTWTSLNQWSVSVPVDSATNQWILAGVDVRGRVLSNLTTTVTVNYTGAAPDPEGWVVFNEIMYNPAVPDASFVELHNASSDHAFNLSGWRIDGLDFTFPPGSALAAGLYLVLAGDRAAFAGAYPPGTPSPLASFPGNLRNDDEVLTLLRPGPEPGEEIVVDQVRYGSAPPWPAAADGLGASLQLIDPLQDNRRVANWSVVATDGAVVPQWIQVIARGTASSSTLYLYLQSAGDLYLDDLRLVSGSVPEAGSNVVVNGNFESPLAGTWTISANHSGSALSNQVKYSGKSSLHLVASSGGSSRSSSIYQEINPALTQGQPYTLSFWYRQSTHGGPLTLRLSGSGIEATIDPAPPVSWPFTPGAPNSVLSSLTPFPTLWLNEVQPVNLTGPADNTGEREPWIELYNSGSEAIRLDDLSLSQTSNNILEWTFPENTIISGGGFLRVWLDGEPAESTLADLHASFRLESQTETVTIARPGLTAPEVLDYLSFGTVAADQSYGSLPDGQPIDRQVLFTATPGTNNSAAQPPVALFVNEWMAANTEVSGVADPADNRYQDWFEIFNPGQRPVDLEGWYLSDAITNRLQFQIPAGYVVPSRGYLVVWADGEPEQNATSRADLHVDFRLDQDGEAISLARPDGTVVDTVVFRSQTNDVSQGRFPDGSTTIRFLQAPTPGAANDTGPTAEAPVFTEVEVRLENVVDLSLCTVAGRTYQIEYCDDLKEAGWTPLSDPQVATGASLAFQDSTVSRGQRFYRAILMNR